MTSSRRLAPSALGLLTALPLMLLGACNTATDADLAGGDTPTVSTNQPLIGADGIKYFFDPSTLNNVFVCFNGVFLWDGGTPNNVYTGTWTKDTSNYQTEIGWMESAISAQWGANTGLAFHYYASCPTPIPSYYVPITLVKGYGLGDIGGMAALGVGGRLGDAVFQGTDPEQQIYEFVYKDDALSEKEIKFVAVHEMGHVLGFPHELDRSNFTSYTMQNGTPEGVKCNPGGASDVNFYYSADYDPNSVMNYCRDANGDGFPDAYRPEINEYLTDMDKAGAQMTYGFPLLFQV